MAIIPKCLAILVCEGVVEDSRTRNKCILNTYNTINSPQFPARKDRLAVFVSLTDGRGESPLELRLIRFENGMSNGMLSLKGKIEFKDPVTVVDVTFDIRDLIFPAPGEYEIQVWIGDEMIGARKMTAVVALEGRS